MRLAFERHLWAYLLVIPSLIMVGAVVAYPVFSGVRLSFEEFRLNRPGLNGWIGLEHYRELIADTAVRRAVVNTVLYVGFGLLSQLLLGLGAALLLNRNFRGVWLARLAVMLPWFMPTVVTAHMWSLMLDSHLGVINDVLVAVGVLDDYRAWFADPHTALATVVAVELWRSFPIFALFILARLQSIPEEILEAATVDGAGTWVRFRYVVLPLLRPVIAVAAVVETIRLANVPDLLIVLTNGGPGDATEVLSLYAFNTAYSSYDFGYAAAISVVLMVGLMVFTGMYGRISGVVRS